MPGSFFSIPVPWMNCVPFSLCTNTAGMLPALDLYCISPPSSSDGPKPHRNLQGSNCPTSYSSASNHFTLSLPSLWPQAHSHLLIGLAQPCWYLISTKSRNKVLCSDLTSSTLQPRGTGILGPHLPPKQNQSFPAPPLHGIGRIKTFLHHTELLEPGS